MKEPPTTSSEHPKPARALRLWLGLLLPPIAWSVHVQTLYLTSEYGCFTSDFLWNHVASAAAFAVSLAGGVIAWREWGLANQQPESDPGNSPHAGTFMAILGVMGGALFSLVIAAQWLPTLMGVPCDK